MSGTHNKLATQFIFLNYGCFWKGIEDYTISAPPTLPTLDIRTFWSSLHRKTKIYLLATTN